MFIWPKLTGLGLKYSNGNWILDDNGNNINHMEINDSLIWSDYDCNSSIDDICIDSLILMDSDTTNQEYKLMNIQLDLINKENFESTGISFWLDKIKYLEYQSDPHNDNWIDLNENQIWDEDEGTENNQLYDNGEFYQDYGLDKCPDIYEDGQGGCFCEFPFDNCDENLLICSFLRSAKGYKSCRSKNVAKCVF